MRSCWTLAFSLIVTGCRVSPPRASAQQGAPSSDATGASAAANVAASGSPQFPFRKAEDDPEYRAMVAERRKTHPAAQWNPSPLAKWNGALQGYASKVKPGNQRVLAPDRSSFAVYLVAVHNRIHPIFSDEFLTWLDRLSSIDPRNHSALVVRVEIVISGEDGRIVQMGVVRASGSPDFDGGALDAVEQASPFGRPPPGIISSDGNVYFHWEFHRDPVWACSTINARPYRLALESAAVQPSSSPPVPPP